MCAPRFLNYFGKMPLVLSSNNSVLDAFGRVAESKVFGSCVHDLKEVFSSTHNFSLGKGA